MPFDSASAVAVDAPDAPAAPRSRGFDAASARPVPLDPEVDALPKFDAASAEPVQAEDVQPMRKRARDDMEQSMPGMAFMRNPAGTITDAAKAVGKKINEGLDEPILNIPRIPEGVITGAPGISGDVAAGTINTATKTLNSLSTPKNILIAAGLGELGAAAKVGGAVGEAAKLAFATASAYFAAEGAKATGEAAAHAVEVHNDPKATTQEKIEAWLAIAPDAAMTAGGLHGVRAAGKMGPSADVGPETAAREEFNAKLAAEPVRPRDDAAQPAAAPKFDAASAKPVPEKSGIQYTVQRPQPHPATGEEIPGYVQVEARTNEGRGEPMTEEVKARLPDPEAVVDAGVPTGQHTLEEINEQLARAEPNGKFTISMKNAAIDAERATRGEEPILQQAARADETVWKAAEKAIDENPTVADDLIEELQEKPRPLKAEEQAILFQRKIDLQNQFNAATERINGGELSPEEMVTERDARSRTLAEMNAVEEANNVGGSEWGRAGRIRQLNAKEDYSLSNMMAKESAARGRKLNAAEEKQIADLQKKLAEAQEKLTQREQSGPPAKPSRSRIVQALSERADAARERIAARLEKKFTLQAVEGPEAGKLLSVENLSDLADVGAYHLARGIESAAAWSAEMVKEFGDKITPHLKEIRAKAEQLIAAEAADKKLDAAKARKVGAIVKLQNKITMGEVEPTKRVPIEKDAEYNRLQARYEQLKAEAKARLEKIRYDDLSALGKLKEQGLNTYDAARNIMTTGEFSFILRQGKMTALAHPIITAKALPATFKALLSDEVGARAIDLQTMNQPEAAAARAAKLHLVEEGEKMSRQEEIFASKWGESIPVVRNFNQAGRVFLNKVRFDVWKNLREQLPQITPERDAQLAKFVNQATGRGTLGVAESAAVPLGRALFSPRFLASRIQLLVGHSMWGGDAATRKIIAKEYAKALVAAGVYYTLMSQMKDKNGKPATIEKDPRSSDFGKIKVGNTRLDPMAGLAQVITFAARTATLERKDAHGRIQSLRNPKFGGMKWSDVATNFGRSKLHPIPGAIVNLFNGTDLGGNQATIENQSANFVQPLTYVDIYQALQEQNVEEGTALSLLAFLGEGLQTYDANKKRPKPKK